MSKKYIIPHDAIVVVADGQKALLLRNKGDEKFLNLSTEHVLVDDNPPTREQGTDRPGRAFKRAATNSRSAVEETDWHEVEKHRFARRVAAAVEQMAGEKKAEVILVAPARVLSDLRQSLHGDVKNRVVAELARDLTKYPTLEIERYLVAENDAGSGSRG